MAYIADMKKGEALVGALVGNGQCVTFVHAVVVIPPSSEWSQGDQVKNNLAIRPGTVIATFDPDGHYGNHLDGRSHAAIHVGQTTGGIQVLDQWKGHTTQPVHPRTIRFKNGHGHKADDGDQLNVVN